MVYKVGVLHCSEGNRFFKSEFVVVNAGIGNWGLHGGILVSLRLKQDFFSLVNSTF